MKKTFCLPNIGCGYLYFYVHFVVEVICFYFLSSLFPNSLAVWIIPFLYDAFAFVPQSLFGYLSDKYPKLDFGIVSILFLEIAILLKMMNFNIFVALAFLCIGNALMHVKGAEVTLKNSNGYLSHSAIFVSGGSFGVITGKLLAGFKISPLVVLVLALTMIPFILLGDEYKNSKSKPNLSKFNYANKNISPYIVILLAVFVVIIRGYIGYGIPTSWNKTTTQAIIFYFTMGLGKALGGILTDRFGFRKVALFSTLVSIPFLCFGDNMMFVSLIGIMLFSMTMALTLGLLVSVLRKNPGLAFGLTTIGLFLGTAPIFFVKITNIYINIISIVVSSILCSIVLYVISSKEDKHESNI